MCLCLPTPWLQSLLIFSISVRSGQLKASSPCEHWGPAAAGKIPDGCPTCSHWSSVNMELCSPSQQQPLNWISSTSNMRPFYSLSSKVNHRSYKISSSSQFTVHTAVMDTHQCHSTLYELIRSHYIITILFYLVKSWEIIQVKKK